MDTTVNESAVQPHHQPSWSAVVTTAMPVGHSSIASRTEPVDGGRGNHDASALLDRAGGNGDPGA